jgi:hypothetical protein
MHCFPATVILRPSAAPRQELHGATNETIAQRCRDDVDPPTRVGSGNIPTIFGRNDHEPVTIYGDLCDELRIRLTP